MRVQLTNPVSRFKHIQSLQHMCRLVLNHLFHTRFSSLFHWNNFSFVPCWIRFVIRRAVVRKDLIQTLPLPRRLLDYLSYKNCYSEQVESDSSQSPPPEVSLEWVDPHSNNLNHINQSNTYFRIFRQTRKTTVMKLKSMWFWDKQPVFIAHEYDIFVAARKPQIYSISPIELK